MVALLDSVLEEAAPEGNEDEVVRMGHILQAACILDARACVFDLTSRVRWADHRVPSFDVVCCKDNKEPKERKEDPL